MAGLQRLELAQQYIGAGAADVLDRATAERGETGAEDHSGIEQVGIGDHAVVQAGHRLVEQWQHQAVFQVVRGLVVGRHVRLDRLAFLPLVQALAVLLAALVRLHRRQRLRDLQAQERRQLLAHAGCHVQADGVDQLDRPHRHAELHRRLVDRRAGDALGVGVGRLQHVREQHAVDQEAGRARHRYRQLVQRLAEGRQPLAGLRRHAVVLHDLHQRHLRHRIEVVQAGELRRALDVLAQFVQRDRRGIGGQQRIGLQSRLDGLVQLALGVRVLDDRLDHQVGLGDARALQVALEPRRHRRTLALVLDAPGEQRIGACQRGIDEALLAVLQRHLEPLVGRPGGDVAAHHAGTDHVHVPDAVVLAAQALEPFGEEEDADQVARGRCAGELDHRTALGVQSRLDAAAAAALPHIDQRVGRGILLLACLARDLLGHLRRQDLPRRPGVGGPRGGALLEWTRGAAQCERDRGIDQHRRCHDLVHQAHRPGRRGTDAAPGQHQVHRRRRADQARQARAAAPAGEDAELGLGQADAGGGIVAGHAVAAGQRDLGAAAHAEAVDRGHRRARQFGQLLERGLAAADRVVDRALAVVLLEFLQVGAGDEARRLGRADHHALGRIDGDAFQQVAQLDQHVLRERVDRGALAVQAEHDDAVVAYLGKPVAESKPIEACKHGVDHPVVYGQGRYHPEVVSIPSNPNVPTRELIRDRWHARA